MRFGWRGALGMLLSVALLWYAFRHRVGTCGSRDSPLESLAPVALGDRGDRDIPSARAALAYDPRSRRAKPSLRPTLARDGDRDDGEQRGSGARWRARTRVRALARG